MNCRLPLLVAVLVFGCSAPQKPSLPEATPAAPRALLASSERVAQAARTIQGAELDLEAFEPLIASAGLETAAEAMERGEAGVAADLVQKGIDQQKPTGFDRLRWQYLLGRLREADGANVQAAAAYERAGSHPWALTAYAKLGQARCLSKTGDSRRAMALLESMPSTGTTGIAALLVRASAARAIGEREEAISDWRKALNTESVGANLPAVALLLAEALLECEQRTPAAPVAVSAAAPASITGASCSPESVSEALGVVREILLASRGSEEQLTQARQLEERALGMLTPSQRIRLEPLSLSQRLTALGALVDARRFADACAAGDSLLAALGEKESFGEIGCEARVLQAKAWAGARQWGRASETLELMLSKCKVSTDLNARAEYLAGKYADADGRQMKAIMHFATVEKEAPTHRLADDSRLMGAKIWLERGVEARFTTMLASMPEDYPDGDMMLDGVFTLALRRIEKGDWSGASSVLERAAALVKGKDVLRGQEFSGRERYFLARARIEMGQRERGLQDLVEIVRELPLSYYMLQAYSRLVEDDPYHARRVLSDSLEKASEAPFSFERRREFEEPGFVRAMELLRIGDIEQAKSEIDASKLTEGSQAPAVLWGIALLYERAGVPSLGHAVVRGLLSDWLSQWPAGDWIRAWKIAFPRPFQALVEKEAAKNGIPEYLAYGVMREESAFRQGVVSPANAYGLMQIIIPTAKAYARPLGLPWDGNSLKRPVVNIALGCRILGDLSRRFDSNPLLAIPGYNAGPGRPRRWVRERPTADFDVWVELIPFRETHRYTKRVLASRAAYAFLYHPEQAEEAMTFPRQVSR